MSAPEVERIRELFAADELAARMGVELREVTDRSVALAMPVRSDHVGWHGRCHGGVVFTLADIAMSYLGNRFPQMAYATHAAIDFVGAIEVGDVVEVVAEEASRRGRSAVCDVTLRVGDDVVALFRGNTLGVRSSKPG